MRRPVLYLAGLIMATGASLALAGPASAAPARHHDNGHHCHHNHHGGHWYGYSSDYDYNLRYHHADRYDTDARFYGVNVLNGVFGGGGGLL